MRTPPGRAGRVWLRRRIAVAERAEKLLDQQHRILAREERRLTELEARTSQAWRLAADEAERWNTRALVSGGRDELDRVAASVVPSEVRLEWSTRSGVRSPSVAALEATPPSEVLHPALRESASAGRRALEAAVQHAAASEALRAVRAELGVTTRRLRAIRERWAPQLHDELTALELRLEETEREELIGRRGGRTSPLEAEGGRR